MALLEILALEVGPVVGKAILKAWLRDWDIGADVSTGILDILVARTTDAVAHVRGERQFMDIGERIAEDLTPIFEEANFEDATKAAIALQVADTLRNVKIDATTLAENDLDPATFSRVLLNYRRQAIGKEYGTDELAFYYRLVTELAANILDIASQLPAFSERTFAEVLKRQREITEAVEQVRKEISRIRDDSRRANPELAAAHFEEQYRRAIVRRFDELELFGAPPTITNRRHRLSTAYITLSCEKQLLHVRQPVASAVLASGVATADSDDDTKIVVGAEAALASTRRLLVRGAPGSGKTTLLQWVAVRSAFQDFPAELRDWNNSIPFIIRLREWANRPLPRPEEIAAHVAPEIVATMPHDWVHRQFDEQRAILLIDGLDEIALEQRQNVRDWLRGLTDTFRDARYIVTSRPYAVEQEDWVKELGFDVAELQPMSIQDIDAFIVRWHEAIRSELRDEAQIERLPVLAASLQKEIHRDRALRKLADSPLLCALLCALYQIKQQQLPSDRIELYSACAQMLIHERDVERRIALRDYPSLRYREKRVLLDDLAYWMLKNSLSAAPVAEVDERLKRKSAQLVRRIMARPGAIRKLFVERSGILREPTKDYIDFTHRTFQEFFAARAVLDEADTNVLVNNAHDTHWHEVVVLAVGIGSKQQRDTIIRSLIERGNNDPALRTQLHLLAATCLETSTDLEPELTRLVQYHLRQLYPPASISEAKLLAEAGDLAVPFLGRSSYLTARAAVASVRALTIIGTDPAIEAIKQYRGDGRQTVRRELVKAALSLESDELAHDVLGSWDLPILELDTVQTLNGLEHLITITELHVGLGTHVTDLGPLAQLQKLEGLHIRQCRGLTDLSPRSVTQGVSRVLRDRIGSRPGVDRALGDIG